MLFHFVSENLVRQKTEHKTIFALIVIVKNEITVKQINFIGRGLKNLYNKGKYKQGEKTEIGSLPKPLRIHHTLHCNWWEADQYASTLSWGNWASTGQCESWVDSAELHA